MVKFAIIIPSNRSCQQIQDNLKLLFPIVPQNWDVQFVEDAVSESGSVANIPEWPSHWNLHRISHPMGAGFARNLAARSTSASWLVFLDSDDRFLPGFSDVFQNYTENNSDASAFMARFVFPLIDPKNIYPKSKFSVNKYDLCTENVLGSFSGFCIKRDAYLSIGGCDEELTSCQDWDLFLRLSREKPVEIIEEITTQRFASEDSISNSPAKVEAGLREILRKFVFQNSSNLLLHERLRLFQTVRKKLSNLIPKKEFQKLHLTFIQEFPFSARAWKICLLGLFMSKIR